MAQRGIGNQANRSPYGATADRHPVARKSERARGGRDRIPDRRDDGRVLCRRSESNDQQRVPDAQPMLLRNERRRRCALPDCQEGRGLLWMPDDEVAVGAKHEASGIVADEGDHRRIAQARRTEAKERYRDGTDTGRRCAETSVRTAEEHVVEPGRGVPERCPAAAGHSPRAELPLKDVRRAERDLKRIAKLVGHVATRKEATAAGVARHTYVGEARSATSNRAHPTGTAAMLASHWTDYGVSPPRQRVLPLGSSRAGARSPRA